MTSTMSDLDIINANLMNDWVLNAFPKDAQPGDRVSGRIVEMARRHRQDAEGNLLYWVDRKPQPIPSDQPVYDDLVILQTDVHDGPEDDGLRSLRLDRDSRRVIKSMITKAGATRVDLGGFIENFEFVGATDSGGRRYAAGTYTPPQNDQ